MAQIDPDRRMKISILGAGAWGTALATALAQRHDVLLWGRDKAAVLLMRQQRENTAYLANTRLPDTLLLEADFDVALAHCAPTGNDDSLLVVATPVAALRTLAQRLHDKSVPNLIWLCKGLEEAGGFLPHQIVRAELGADLMIGALSGPSFAQEVAHGLPAALAFAADSRELRETAVQALHSPLLRIYATDDLIGVEVGGAVKNILAIATGIVDGLQLGMNARAALITRGLAEITRLGIALGGRAETFMGLSGMGDLILTCTGDLSRNRQVGLALAQGKPLATIIAELGHVAEGVRCARAVRTLAAQLQVDMPITRAVCRVLDNAIAPLDAVQELLQRDPKAEHG